MIIKSVPPSPEALAILKALQEAVSKNLDKKKAARPICCDLARRPSGSGWRRCAEVSALNALRWFPSSSLVT